MEAVRKPDVNIGHHGTWPDGLQRRLADWDGMLAQCWEKALVEHHAVRPKGRLTVYCTGHRDLRLHEPAAAFDLCAGSISEESETTPGDPLCLFANFFVG